MANLIRHETFIIKTIQRFKMVKHSFLTLKKTHTYFFNNSYHHIIRSLRWISLQCTILTKKKLQFVTNFLKVRSHYLLAGRSAGVLHILRSASNLPRIYARMGRGCLCVCACLCHCTHSFT